MKTTLPKGGPVEELRRLLRTLASGPVRSRDEVSALLAAAWGCFPGSAETSMEPWKVQRAENLRWEPPVLSFEIERHGGTVCGSTRAEIQRWEVNLETLRACYYSAGRRQLHPADKSLDTKRLASEVADQIGRCGKVKYLQWLSESRVRVLVGVLIPATNRQTTAGRRKRFATQLQELLQACGWRRALGTAPHTYKKLSEGNQTNSQ